MAAKRREQVTREQLIRDAIKVFFELGYSGASLRRLSRELDVSGGTLTHQFPTKDHLLLELVKGMTVFQWQMTTDMENAGTAPLLAYALEIAIQTAMCEENAAAKELYIAAYTSPLCVAHIKEWAHKKAHQLFRDWHPGWTLRDYRWVENATTAVELSALTEPCTQEYTLAEKIRVTVDCLLKIYEIPETDRRATIETILAMDYSTLGRETMEQFIQQINAANDRAVEEVLEKKKKNEQRVLEKTAKPPVSPEA